MTIETEKNAAIIGTDVEVGGVTSATIPRNTVTDNKLVVSEVGDSNKYTFIIYIYVEETKLKRGNIRRVIFSPHSDGIVNPRTLLNRKRMLGMIQFIP